MADYNSFPAPKSGISACVVAGGHKDDPAEDQSCNQRVYLPLEHSPQGVEKEHLALSSMQHSPTGHSQQAFPGTLDPGTLVYVMKRSEEHTSELQSH